MALSLNKVLRGPITVQFINSGSPDTTILSYTGLKPDTVKLNISREKDEVEIEDGVKIKTRKGLVGTLEMTLSQLDQTDMALLESKAPGKSGDIDKIKVIFTSLGSGTDTYLIVDHLTDYDNSIETGNTWGLKHVFGISAGADVELSGVITVAHA